MGEIQKFAQVLVNKNIGGLLKTYQYKINDKITKEVKIGSRVIVPFNKILVDGFILRFDNNAVVDNVKEIVSVIDDDLTLNEEIISVAKWMKEQYLCSLALCLRCFLPSGSITKVKKYVTTNKNLSNKKFDKQEKIIVDYILDRKKVLERTIQKKFGDNKNIINNLKQKNILKENYYIDSGVKKKKTKKIRLIKNSEHALNCMNKNAVKQREIINYLSKKQEIDLKELVKNTKCSYSTVQQLQQKKLVDITFESHFIQESLDKTSYKLSFEQQKAFDRLKNSIEESIPKRFLLHGTTGSGKTEIYIRLIKEYIKRGKQCIVLVPEITLTHYLVKKLRNEFGDNVATIHSGITDSEKYRYWCKINKGLCKVVVGARSAVFAPCNNLGIIIIDEEHEWTYKQDNNPKYHTKEIAWKRIQMNNGLLLLGSATPSIETYWKAANKEIKLLELKQRIFNRPLPIIDVIDMREEFKEGNYSIFSNKLLDYLNSIISKNESAILFVPRRGYSSYILCKTCGFIMECPNCKVTLTYHKDTDELKCHYCHYKQDVPYRCPHCESNTWKKYGVGTQQVEEVLSARFDSSKIIRIDSDTTSKKGKLENKLLHFEEKGGILVGTQMISKGLHFPDVTLAAVVDADSSLNLPDFRSRERNFQLLTQVAGRAGRGNKKGKVIIQTHNPDDPSIMMAKEHDYLGFYNFEILQRKNYKYPPFIHLIKLNITHKRNNTSESAANNIFMLLKNSFNKYKNIVTFLGPAPSPISKINNNYRWQIIIKTRNLKLVRNNLNKIIDNYFQNHGTSVKIEVDINPFGML